MRYNSCEVTRTWLYIDLMSYMVICESAVPRDSMRSMAGDEEVVGDDEVVGDEEVVGVVNADDGVGGVPVQRDR